MLDEMLGICIWYLGTVLSGCIEQCTAAETCATTTNPPYFEKIVEGHPTAEGPVFTKDGNFYMVAAGVQVNGTHAGQILKIDLENKKATVLLSPSVGGFGGRPNGYQCDHENNIWVADMRLGILKVNQNGTFQQIATKDNQGDDLQGCNDLMFDYHGNLWLTAPAGPIAPHNFIQSFEDPFGSLYCYTRAGELSKIATGLLFPNGLAVQHNSRGDPVKLIFGQSFNKKAYLSSFDIVGPCQVTNKQIWGTSRSRNFIPDGMDFDAEGNLIVTNIGKGALDVYRPNGGKPICHINCPFRPSNVHFRPDSNELYITEHSFDGLWKLRDWKTKGMKQYCEL